MDEPDGPESDEMQSLNFPAFSLTFGGRDPAQVQSQPCGVRVAHMLSCKQTNYAMIKATWRWLQPQKKGKKRGANPQWLLSSERGQARLQKNCFEWWIGIAGIF